MYGLVPIGNPTGATGAWFARQSAATRLFVGLSMLLLVLNVWPVVEASLSGAYKTSRRRVRRAA